ncbi:ribonucleoside-diphosphate reductase subunit alpha [Bacillus sp. LMB3902]|uniref:ribonucleoside-diphosphate reductase subunit alpha n=1 Tax=Bacillus sp. LMB3902 TaxID=3139827 RepID=UPI0031979BFF
MTTITKENGLRRLPFNKERLTNFILRTTDRFPSLTESAKVYIKEIVESIEAKDEYSAEQITNLLIITSNERTSQFEPDWAYVASDFYLKKLYKEASRNRCYDAKVKYGSLYGLLKTLGAKGIYHQHLLRDYSKEEIDHLETIINPAKDMLFKYFGLRIFEEKYLATDHKKNVYELPQERFMIISMWLMKNEDRNKRLDYVKKLYWALSNHYMTVATPTLANAGKSYGQLSSCFIITEEDSLRSIYDSNTDIATLSKNGGGIGVYLGKIRAKGSDIKGFKGISGGVVPWVKGINQTAVSVDQLGQRQGAIAVYLDIFHKDIMDFLDLRLNTGDERLRAHDIFTGVSIPDLFMRKLKEVDENGRSIGQWHTFDPHEVKQLMGWKDENGNPLGLEDFYDEDDIKYFTEKYEEAVAHPLLSRKTYRAMDIMIQIMMSQLETGTPYMFYRDAVNRANPNKHLVPLGRTSIFSSNLCSEIAQNTSATQFITETLNDETGEITIKKKSGDMVVCNLSSINLARAVRDKVLSELIPIQVRALDNVIDLNNIEVPEARYTNKRFRGIGLGTFGLHHLLALEGIKWESPEAIDFQDKLYEEIAYLTIKSSMELSKEKGHYELFENSEWHTGRYFERRGYDAERWKELRELVSKNGLRNGFLMAIAPNATTAHVAGTSPSIDPIYMKEYEEQKRRYRVIVTAPDISPKTTWFYKSAFLIDQHWSVKQNAARQKHVDQAISFNLYVPSEIPASELLSLHMEAWESGVKTTYYVRTMEQEKINECDSCQ